MRTDENIAKKSSAWGLTPNTNMQISTQGLPDNVQFCTKSFASVTLFNLHNNPVRPYHPTFLNEESQV